MSTEVRRYALVIINAAFAGALTASLSYSLDARIWPGTLFTFALSLLIGVALTRRAKAKADQPGPGTDLTEETRSDRHR